MLAFFQQLKQHYARNQEASNKNQLDYINTQQESTVATITKLTMTATKSAGITTRSTTNTTTNITPKASKQSHNQSHR